MLAISERCCAVSFSALARPPLRPPSFPSATAAGFFFLGFNFSPIASSTTRSAFCTSSSLLERLCILRIMPQKRLFSREEISPPTYQACREAGATTGFTIEGAKQSRIGHLADALHRIILRFSGDYYAPLRTVVMIFKEVFVIRLFHSIHKERR